MKSILINIFNKLPYAIQNMYGCYNKVHRFYAKAQYWSLKDIDNWQLNKLKLLVEYAYNNTDGYHQLYDEAKVKPEDIKSLEDIIKLPFTDKVLLRDNIKAFTTNSIKKADLSYAATGGSTGIPFAFYYDKKNAAAEYAFMYSSWESIGWKQEDIGVILRGTFLGSADNLIQKTGRKRYSMSSCFLSQDNYRMYIDSILETQATFLHAYPSSATELASLIIDNNEQGVLPFKHIFLGSENLYDWQKALINEAFPAAKIMSWYGHTERAIWAPYCELKDKYHLNPFYGYSEIVGLDGKAVDINERGELVGTSFWMFGTPFIRYKTMDFAQKGNFCCTECGRQFQLLEMVDGRLMEMIVGKTGRRISLTVFAGSVMHGKIFESICQFRFIQKVPGKLELLVKFKTIASNGVIAQLQESIDTFLGDDFECDIYIVDEIPKSRSGKFTYLEQHLDISRADRLEY